MLNPQEASPQKYNSMTFYKHELQPLTAELQKKAEVELNEMVSQRDEDIEEFRNMVAKEEDLHANMSDAFLIRFLRARKYHKDRALKLIKDFYKGKKKFKHIFNVGLVPSQVKHVYEKNVLTVLPYPDLQGRAIVLFRPRLWNTSEFPPEDVLIALYFATEKLLEDARFQVNGVVGFVDAEGVTFRHYLQFRPMIAYTLLHFMQDCMPVRVKAAHFIKESALIDLGFTLIWPLLKPKFKKRVFFHGHNMASLHQHISPEHLPKAYGGTMCDVLDGSDWTKIMVDSDKYFHEDLQFGYHAT